MKEKLSGVLGAFGIVVYYLVLILLFVLPFSILSLPGIFRFILIVLYFAWPSLSMIFCSALYIWGFIVAVQQPIDALSIIFFVACVIAGIFIVFPSVELIAAIIRELVGRWKK